MRLTKPFIAKKYGLSLRDVRAIDVYRGLPHILIRESTILIHMFDLRLLVQANKALLFHGPEVHGHRHDNIKRVFTELTGKLCVGHNSGNSATLPYELRVVEAALASVTSTLEAEYLLIKQEVSKSLKVLDRQMLDRDGALVHSELRTLLDLVRKIADIEQRARHVRSAIQDVLNEDEDMAGMYLSDKVAGRRHESQDHQEVEYLLESYYKASNTVVHEATSMMGNIQKTEEAVQSALNVRRNQIMALEAKIEILMLGLAPATLGAGLYGMNVINYAEDGGWAFAILVSSCFAGTVLIWRWGMRALRYIQKGQS
ncbi:hypothetical protein FQN49_006946 [Arthroderma sp. PD_2]|nr:hypothetical protein FQN49_006946 [Arthroderma sp. PD_2]